MFRVEIDHETIFLEAIMTSVRALPGVASRIFYVLLTVSVFTFISMLLLTTLHP